MFLLKGLFRQFLELLDTAALIIQTVYLKIAVKVKEMVVTAVQDWFRQP